MTWIQDAARDLAHGARVLRRSLGFTVSAIGVLGVGIGAVSAVFSVVNVVLLQPLPYPRPDRIVQLISTSPVGVSPAVSIPKFILWREQLRVFQHLAAYEEGGPGINLTSGDRPEHLKAIHVSSGYFAVFGAAAALGRTFQEKDDLPHGPLVAVISDSLWRRRFAADPAIVERTIWLGRESYEVIGVMERGFDPGAVVDVWLPLRADPAAADHTNYLRVAGRLKDGVTLRAARFEVARTTPLFRRTFPLALGPYEFFAAEPLRDVLVGKIRPTLRLVSAAVVFVLLLACANVANLLLARYARRRREIATRSALGAGRTRVVRQLLTESLMLAAAGGSLGILIGYLGVRGLAAASPAEIPRLTAYGQVALDGRVLAFTFLLSAITAVVFGLGPALTAARVDLSAFFKDSHPSSAGGWRRDRLQSGLVVAQMTLALVLLAGAALLIRTVQELGSADRGFDTRNVVTFDMSINGTRFEKTGELSTLVENVERRVAPLGGVSGIAASYTLPLEAGLVLPFVIDRRLLFDAGGSHGVTTWAGVSPQYFDVLGIRLLSGRQFTAADLADAAPVAIINRAMARKFWLTDNPVGERITVGGAAGAGVDDASRQVVGVVADVRDAPANQPAGPTVFVPIAQVPGPLHLRNTRLRPLTWISRTAVAPSLAAGAIVTELTQTSALPIVRTRTMEEIVSASTKRAAFTMFVLTTFAGVGLLLAAMGLFALMSYSVQQRTQEIGIRMALGAQPGHIRGMVANQALRLVACGIALGIIAALALTRLMATIVFGVRTWDPVVLSSAAAVLCAVALAAAYLPARRATSIDPLDAVR
jgi:putative ABC transport system permease protein